MLGDYIENLCRLKLIDVDFDSELVNNEGYIQIEKRLKFYYKEIKGISSIEFHRGCLIITKFGWNFCKTCISEF